ncbi:MAG: hypothetical protein IKW62_01015 [Clostridia bacterium]|nr:hypothetical protein [Clostridia bacterium]
MRKFGSSRRNPNPPWPGVQQGVVLPPGSNMSAINRNNAEVKGNENIIVKNRELDSADARDSFTPVSDNRNTDEMRSGGVDSVSTRDGFMPIMNNDNPVRMRDGEMGPIHTRDGFMPIMNNDNPVRMRDGEIGPIHTRNGFIPIMNYMNEGGISQAQSSGLQNRGCANISVSDYLCDKMGNYARVEFLFGDNTHVEKTGIIESVGKDFIVLTEAGSGSHIVCSAKNIKFINIFNFK